MTLRQLLKAIKQLHYHSKRLEWMGKRIEENEQVIASELITRGKQRLAIGGFLISLSDEREVVIEKLPPVAFDQPELPLERKERLESSICLSHSQTVSKGGERDGELIRDWQDQPG